MKKVSRLTAFIVLLGIVCAIFSLIIFAAVNYPTAFGHSIFNNSVFIAGTDITYIIGLPLFFLLLIYKACLIIIRRNKLSRTILICGTIAGVIGIVGLGILFWIAGNSCVFCGAKLIGTDCVASPGYYCQNAVLITNGNLSFTFGQNTGSTMYNIALASSATSNDAGYPSGGFAAFNSIDINGNDIGTVSNSTLGTTLASGQTIQVNAIPVVGRNGMEIGNSSVGSAYSGYIWLTYTTSAGPPSNSSNPWYTVKVATLTVKVV